MAAHGTSPATAATRHATITRWLLDEGRLDVVDVAARLGVAAETVRRDLRALETAGKLQRVHGGAVALDPQPLAALNLHPVNTADALANVDPADLRLAMMVWAWLPRRGTILLGGGRLTSVLAHAVVVEPPDEPGLTVVTNSLDAAIILSRVAGVSVYNVGGTVSSRTRTQEGDWALEEFRRLHVEVSVIAPAGISLTTGLTQPTHAAAAVAQAEISCADRVLVLADPTSLGHSALVQFGHLDEVEEVVVTGHPGREVLDAFGSAGVRLTLAEHHPGVGTERVGP